MPRSRISIRIPMKMIITGNTLDARVTQTVGNPIYISKKIRSPPIRNAAIYVSRLPKLKKQPRSRMNPMVFAQPKGFQPKLRFISKLIFAALPVG